MYAPLLPSFQLPSVLTYAQMCRADETTKIHGAFADWLLADGRSQNEYPTAFNFAFKTQGKFYEWLETPRNEKRLGRFGHAMNGTRYWEVAENIAHGACVPRAPSDSDFFVFCGGADAI